MPDCPQRPSPSQHHVSFTAEPLSLTDISSQEACIDDVLQILSLHMPEVDPSANQIDYSSAFFVTVEIDQLPPRQAYIDSGASHSCVPQRLLDKLSEEQHQSFRPPAGPSRISLGAQGAYADRT